MTPKNEKTGKIVGKHTLGDFVIRGALLIYGLIVLFPLIWVMYTSFKTSREFYENPWGLPETFSFENYVNAWHSAKIGTYFSNSILVTAGMVVLTLILSSMLAYILSRFTFTGRNIIQSLIIAGLLVPSVLGTIPVFTLMKSLGLTNSHLGLIIVYTAYAMPFSVFVLIGFFKSIPRDMEEAGMIDGASHYRIFRSIMFPLARPGVITISIFNFLWYWNEYAFALTLLSSETKRTLPLGLAFLTTSQRYKTEWGELFAGVIIIMIPVVLVYILFQRKLISGLNTGAVKE
ncbi:carbohydrate ABC transporter permease [Xylanibacillus composti]|uniref:Sugar ABC transporter permease n=1 Tax=Xylanibacillus composti TaxID=1572762 RepID=A0A8J4H8E6_9BACL|nr:carbohydrate ABC transporter permease [Xylanibacillus composti]MDT9726344.1 carbohydrate ABC transporter permease [Xylanibacillus composti]GIQ70548.1 sugar ABC transporter permease [Xylanibacillus composti]